MATKHKDDFEPYWQDEKDWLCIVEFLPTDNPEARLGPPHSAIALLLLLQLLAGG